ncbi:MAG: glycosyltransferase family 61 protein, partial [Actinobacteria bacterium]|nr:glycosyltransferase family 61 protein [Actinomycetota bacterium]
GLGEVAAPERWYVPARLGFQRELLDLVGVTADRRIDADEHPHVRAECLVLPAPPSMTVINPPWVVEYLRSTLLDPRLARAPGRGIYVTRGGAANNRQIVNEDDVIAALRRRGFEVIDPARMPVREQVRAFAEASVIVAAHGAALANLVFASPGASVVELFPAAGVLPDYWKL